MQLTAITRPVPASLANCQLTHLARSVIDVRRAAAQHAAYETVLRSLGVEVVQLSPTPELPDSVFIEDTAVVLPEVAIVTRPGADSRRAEVSAVEQALTGHRRVVRIEPPGTLDGGDVLVVAERRRLFVGRSTRTNDAGIEQLRTVVDEVGYEVVVVQMQDCLHLKSAATQISRAGEPPVLLVNPHWLPAGAFGNIACLPIHPDEPYAANTLRIGDALLHASQFTLTRHILHLHGYTATPVDNDELAKAEGALTCCSIIFEDA